MHLHRRFRFRTGWNHTNGQNIPAGFGARPQQGVAPERLETIADVLRKAGIKADISDDINRDTFIKWSFISAMACTGAYHDVPMGPLQHPGAERDTFIGLSKESSEIGRKWELPMRKTR